MSLEIVKNSNYTVSENYMETLWIGPLEKIDILKNFGFTLCAGRIGDDISIRLGIDSQFPKVTFTCHHENTSKLSRNEAGLFKNGVMIIDSTLIVTVDPKLLRKVKHQIPTSVLLLEDERFKDFSIQVDGNNIKLHKSVLAVFSPVFSAMLQPHCKEFQEGKVIIKDFDFATVKTAVDLMYKREIDNDLPIKTMLKLYKFADKYDLLDTEKVLRKIYSKMNLTTISEISKFSKQNLMTRLYDDCVEYFARGFNNFIHEINDFDNLEPNFMMDVLKKYRSNEKK
uniref:BTB domain-containing protein n=1 Tax=Panagrolaimus sp. JU765 TaxID=591449 RepID=A0AC34QM76_9BILA